MLVVDGTDVGEDGTKDLEDGIEVDVQLDATTNGVGTVDEVPPGAIVLIALWPPLDGAVVTNEDVGEEDEGVVVEVVDDDDDDDDAVITKVADFVPAPH